MENKIYVMVYLYAYPKLKMMEESIGISVETRAALSYRLKGDALTLAERIVHDIALKEKLCCLRRAIEEVLGGLSEEEQILYEYKYLHRRALRERVMEIACCLRRYYRLQNELLRTVRTKLMVLGYTEKAFFEDYGDFSLFMRMWERLRDGQVSRKRNSAHGHGSSAGAGRFPRRIKTAIARSTNTAAQIAATCTAEGAKEGSDGGISPAEGVRKSEFSSYMTSCVAGT